MKYNFVLFFFLLISLHIHSQSIGELNKTFYNAEYNKVINSGQKLLKTDADNATIFYLIGISYQMLNYTKQADSFLYKAYLQDSTNIQFINAYANISKKNNSLKKAIFYYNKTLKIDSLNYTALNSLSKLYIESKSYKSALSVTLFLSGKDSLNSYYYRNIAYLYIKMKEYAKGFQSYEKAYAIDSTDNKNIKALASAYLKAKKLNKAIAICDKGILIDSVYSHFYKIKADALFARRHMYRAIPQYKKTLLYGDSSYNVVKRLGMSLCDTENFEDALQYNMAVYMADSSLYSNSFYLSKTYLGLKQYDKCIQYSEKTLSLLRYQKRTTAFMYDNMALAYAGQAKYKDALKMFDEKYKVFERRGIQDNFNIAKIHDKSGHKKTAIKFYEKVTEEKKKNSASLKYDKVYQYATGRITRLLEDLHFE